MYKFLVLSCVVISVIEARPKWQFLPPKDGYIPVYIRPGDTPLEEINPDLAEAFHALPAGRSAGKHLEASEESLEYPLKGTKDDQSASREDELAKPKEDASKPHEDHSNEDHSNSSDSIDHRPYEKKDLEKKTKKNGIIKPEERR